MKLSKQNQAFTDLCSFINEKLKKSGQRFRIGFVNQRGGSKYVYFFERESKSKIGTQYYMDSNKQMMSYLKGIGNLLSMIQVMEHPVNAITYGIINEQKWIDGLDYSAAEMINAFAPKIALDIKTTSNFLNQQFYEVTNGTDKTDIPLTSQEAQLILHDGKHNGYWMSPIDNKDYKWYLTNGFSTKLHPSGRMFTREEAEKEAEKLKSFWIEEDKPTTIR